MMESDILESIYANVKETLQKAHSEDDDFKRASLFQKCLQGILNNIESFVDETDTE